MKKNTNVLSKWKQSCVVFFACLMICSVAAQSKQVLADQDVNKTYFFAAPTLETINIAGTL